MKTWPWLRRLLEAAGLLRAAAAPPPRWQRLAPGVFVRSLERADLEQREPQPRRRPWLQRRWRSEL